MAASYLAVKQWPLAILLSSAFFYFLRYTAGLSDRLPFVRRGNSRTELYHSDFNAALLGNSGTGMTESVSAFLLLLLFYALYRSDSKHWWYAAAGVIGRLSLFEPVFNGHIYFTCILVHIL